LFDIGKDLNYDQPPMRKTFVLHFGQVPCVAFRPFFMVIFFAPFMLTFFLHFTQYASTAMVFT